MERIEKITNILNKLREENIMLKQKTEDLEYEIECLLNAANQNNNEMIAQIDNILSLKLHDENKK